MLPLLWRLTPLLLLAVLAGALWRVPGVPAAEVQYLRIAVGPTSTPDFQAATALAGLISRPPGLPACVPDRPCGVPGLIALAQSLPAQEDIVAAVSGGEMETGLVPAGAAFAARCQAIRGRAEAVGTATNIAILGDLYQEALHVLVQPGQGIGSPADLKGRHVAVGAPGGEERRLAERVLAAYGLRIKDVRPLAIGGDEAMAALREGRADAAFRLAVWPDAGVTSLVAAGRATLLSIHGEEARRLLDQQPFGSEGAIPVGTYGDAGAVATLMQPVVWIVRADADADMVRNLAAALAQPANRDRLAAEQADLTLAPPLPARLAAPLHPGAVDAYGQDAPVSPCPTASAS